MNSVPDRDAHLGCALIALATLISSYVLLGPLMLGVIQFRVSAAALEQVEGGDLAALCVVVPLCLAAGVLAFRRAMAAAVVALAPASFAIYTYSQLFLGNEFVVRPGNVERYFPLFWAIVLLAAYVLQRAWTTVGKRQWRLPRRRERRLGWLFMTIALFVVAGIHLPNYVDAMRSHPVGSAYLADPAVFWVVKFWDLAVVVPIAACVGVGLLRGRAWATRPAIAALGGFVLLGCAVTAMAARMYVVGDPDSSLVMLLASAAITIAGARLVVAVDRPALDGTLVLPSQDVGQSSGERERVRL